MTHPARPAPHPAPPPRKAVLMPHEAAALCGVTQKTLARWAISGNLPFTTTMGGHRRYAYADVMALLAVQRTTVHLPPRRSS